MSIWMPPAFRAEVEQDRQEIVQQVMEVESTLAVFNKELREIDPHTRMIRARDDASPYGPLKAGYYHVIRDAPGMPVYVTPLMWDNGEYREPGSWVFQHLQEEDLWNDRYQRSAKERNKKFAASEQKRRDREALARAADYDDRLKHAMSTQILVSKDIPK